MCLAIPGKIVDLYEEEGLSMGRINYAGTINTACLAYIENPQLGDYVLVHAGFAINRLDEAEAKRTLDQWDAIVARAAEDGEDIFGMPLNQPDDQSVTNSSKGQPIDNNSIGGP